MAKEVVWTKLEVVLHHYAWRLVGMRVGRRKKGYVLSVMLTQLNLNMGLYTMQYPVNFIMISERNLLPVVCLVNGIMFNNDKFVLQ